MIKLIKNEFGDLVTPDTSDLHIKVSADAPRPGIRVENILNQNQVEEVSPLFQKYNFLIFWLMVNQNDICLDFRNLPDINKLRYIDFTFLGKNCGFNLLKDPQVTLDGLKEFKLISHYSIDFNQYINLKNLKILTVQHHKNSSGWMDHDGIIDLIIHKFKETDLTSLSKMTSLKRLKIVQGSLKSLKGIENLKNLETLRIYGLRNLTDLSALLQSSSIQNLIFESYTKNTNWDFLSQMKQLKFISLNEANSIEFFNDLPNLVAGGAIKIHDKNREPEDRLYRRYEDTNIPDKQRTIAVAPLNPFE